MGSPVVTEVRDPAGRNTVATSKFVILIIGDDFIMHQHFALPNVLRS